MRKLVVLMSIALLVSACTPTPVPTGSCEITAVNAVTIYMLPSAAAPEFATLPANETYLVTARTADGFYGFDPGVAQAGNAGLYRLRWVLKTHDVTTSPGCANLTPVVAPITGLCYAMIMPDTPVYSSADTGSSVLTTLHMNDFVMITGNDGTFLKVDLNVGSASLDQVGYIELGMIGGLKGTCDGL